MITPKPLPASETKMGSYYFEKSMVVFFEPGNARSPGETVIRLYEDPNKIKRFVENSIRSLKKHNWGAYKVMYLNLVDELGK